MNGVLYAVALQWKLDIRSKSLLITCYAVPLLFFALMGGIFTTINPEMKATLIPAMTIMGVSMGALSGLPPSISETYGGDVKKAYQANGIPLYMGMVSMIISAFVHLMIMSCIIFYVAPIAFDAQIPANIPQYFLSLVIFVLISLCIGSVLGMAIKTQSKLTMISQMIFLPSIMLSGILFPVDLLPSFIEKIGKIFPATWGFVLMSDGPGVKSLCAMLVFFVVSVLLNLFFLKKQNSY